MVRWPDGIEAGRFFQKDAPSHMPEWIPTYRALVSTRESPRQKKWVNFPLVNDELALLWMVNMGCIDMNTWYSRVDKPDRPDFVLFDLDPSPDVGFKETVQVALLVKQALDAFGLVGFPKTSGAEGCTSSCRSSGVTRTTTRASSRRSSPARSRDEPRAGDDGVDEVEAARRPDRLEPERRGEDDRLRLLGAAACRRAGVDAAALGRGQREARPAVVHDGRSFATASASTAICSRAC